ncbi:MAG: SurA N-terminal domain-containing protein [Syntrophales bacterium]|nr:SurA N-terminal domain-containing protein [Syntrophales bacterium]
MLELMRKHARNWLMKVILGLIIIVFIFYFGSMGGRQKAETIAIVDGKPIAIADFHREYENLIDSYRQRYGEALTGDLLKRLNLKQQAFDNLVNQAVILHQADKIKLEVIPEEVAAAIVSLPGFQRNGVFDDRIYRQTLRYNKITPEEFEEGQKKTLTISKFENIVFDAIKISDQEVYDLYRFQNEKININFLKFSPKDFRGEIMPSQKDLEAYLKAHGNDFRKPENVQLKYVSFLGQDFAPSVQIADIDVADYYEQHKSEFLKTGGKAAPFEEVREKIISELRRIKGMLIAAEEAKSAHDTIYQEENFDSYIVQKKLKINTSGFFSSNNPPPEFSHIHDFSRIAFDLKANEISDALSDEKGYYIFKLVGRKPSQIPTFTETEKEVERRYIEAESTRLCRQESESILKRLKKGENIKNIAQQNRMQITETGFFLPGAEIPEIGSSRELSEALFQISESKPYPDNVFNINGNFVVIQFKERGRVDNDDFEAKKERLKDILSEIKRSEYLQSWLYKNRLFMLKEGKLKFTRDVKDL